MRQRRRFSDDFRAKVAIEAIKEEKTLQELAEEFQVHPNQISVWKKQFLENAGKIYERRNTKDKELEKAEKQQEALFKQLGQARYEVEWLKKSTRKSTARTTRDD